MRADRLPYHQTKRFYLISTIIVVVFTCILIFSHALKTKANERRRAEDKLYASIMINEGDTLWSIANCYKPEAVSTREYIHALKAMNHLTSDTIKTGNYLIVYYYGTDTAVLQTINNCNNMTGDVQQPD